MVLMDAVVDRRLAVFILNSDKNNDVSTPPSVGFNLAFILS